MKVKIKLLRSTAKMPTQAYEGDAGYDLYVASLEYDLANTGQIRYNFGLSLEIPKGYAGFIFPRSSVSDTCLSLSNCVGVIDSGYRGEISAIFNINTVSKTRGRELYTIGDRAAQLIIMQVPSVTLTQVKELKKSDRGEKGYGSSGNI